VITEEALGDRRDRGGSTNLADLLGRIVAFGHRAEELARLFSGLVGGESAMPTDFHPPRPAAAPILDEVGLLPARQDADAKTDDLVIEDDGVASGGLKSVDNPFCQLRHRGTELERMQAGKKFWKHSGSNRQRNASQFSVGQRRACGQKVS
jgi:hypothetical protein